MEQYNKLEKLVLTIKEDLLKFNEKNNKEAGLRVRIALQKIKKLSQEIRVDIATRRKTMKRKTKLIKLIK